MGVLLPNYPEENVVRGEKVPNFKINTSEGASSNVFKILQDVQLKQYQEQYHLSTALKQYKGQYHLSTVLSTTLKQYEEQLTIRVPCTSTWKSHSVPPTWYRTWHSWLLLSGPPHPQQVQLEE